MPDGHPAWHRRTEHLRPELMQRVLRRRGLPVQPEPRRPALQERRQRELQQLVLPGPWVLRDPERVLRDVILPTGQAPWARLPELRP